MSDERYRSQQGQGSGSSHGDQGMHIWEIDTMPTRAIMSADVSRRTTAGMAPLERVAEPLGIPSRIEFLTIMSASMNELVSPFIAQAGDIFMTVYATAQHSQDEHILKAREFANTAHIGLIRTQYLMSQVATAVQRYTEHFAGMGPAVTVSEEEAKPVRVSTEYEEVRGGLVLAVATDKDEHKTTRDLTPKEFELVVANTLQEKNLQSGYAPQGMLELIKFLEIPVQTEYLTTTELFKEGERSLQAVGDAIRTMQRVLELHAADPAVPLPIVRQGNMRFLDLGRLNTDGHMISTS